VCACVFKTKTFDRNLPAFPSTWFGCSRKTGWRARAVGLIVEGGEVAAEGPGLHCFWSRNLDAPLP
jgi:hypothetical protein